MDKVVLQATQRTVIGKQVNALRRQGVLPAVMYGRKVDPVAISLDLRETTRVLSHVTPSSLITIVLDGKEHITLIQEKQRDYIRGTLTHIDFRVVSMTEKIKAWVDVEMVGVAPAVKEFNGVVVQNVSRIEVECLPADLPERFVVDLSALKRIGSAIRVKDVVTSDAIDVLADMEEDIVIITGVSTQTEEEEVGGTAEPEVIERGKKEEVEE